MKSQRFDPLDPISVIKLLPAFRLAFKNNEVHNGAAMCLVLFLIENGSCSSYSLPLFGVQLFAWYVKKGMLRSLVQVVNHVLETHATDDIFREPDTKKVCSTWPTNMKSL